MDLLGIIIRALVRVIGAFITVDVWVLQALEQGLRSPLTHAGITGITQTAVVAMVPILSLVAAIKLLGGVVRFIAVCMTFLFLLEVMVPALLNAGWSAGM